jgi:dTDP-4-dehydrorhamnose 3,5-epimerase
MNKIDTSLAGVFVLEPRVFEDDRGFFLESYNESVFETLGIGERFVQDNHSFSSKNVVRGLHYQTGRPQGKLVRVIAGTALDVALDLRRSSPSYGKWESFELSGENKRILWIPGGLAHGFCVKSDGAHVLYKATEFYSPKDERTVRWNDPALNIDWELSGQPIVSGKDKSGLAFQEAEKFE